MSFQTWTRLLIVFLYGLATVLVAWLLLDSTVFPLYFMLQISLFLIFTIGTRKKRRKLFSKDELPKSERQRMKWKTLYTIIEPKRAQKEGWKLIQLYLAEHYPDLPNDRKTLSNVFNCGKSGLLDDIQDTQT